MPISITDKERATMAAAIRTTVSTLDVGKFAVDVLVDIGASSATSKISSIYKRHGTILQKALGVAINTDPAWQAWDELSLSHKEYRNGLNIDLILYGRGTLRILEVKRGLGKHDSDAKRGVIKRLTSAEDERNQIFRKCRIAPVGTVECCVVSYYGDHARVNGFARLTRDDLEKEFPGLANFILEVDEYLKFKLGSEIVRDVARALLALDTEESDTAARAYIDGVVNRRKNRSHPWDAL